MRRFVALVLLFGGLLAAASCAGADSSPEPERLPYGREGEHCYSDYSCNDWLTCVNDVCMDIPYDDAGTGTPDAWTPPKDAGKDAAKPKDGALSCGSWGLYCCPGSVCESGTICNANTGICDSCGDMYEACCNSDPPCGTGVVCESGICVKCGDTGKPCCPGLNDCFPGSCVEGTCSACGSKGLICCPGQTCKGTVCKSGKCI